MCMCSYIHFRSFLYPQNKEGVCPGLCVCCSGWKEQLQPQPHQTGHQHPHRGGENIQDCLHASSVGPGVHRGHQTSPAYHLAASEGSIPQHCQCSSKTPATAVIAPGHRSTRAQTSPTSPGSHRHHKQCCPPSLVTSRRSQGPPLLFSITRLFLPSSSLHL